MKKEGQLENHLIENLWQEHQENRFPTGYGGEEIEGVDLALLDADIAGCVDTFLKRRNLDLFRVSILGLCYRDCSIVARELDGVAKEYFLRLETLARLVLESVRHASKA